MIILILKLFSMQREMAAATQSLSLQVKSYENQVCILSGIKKLK